MTGAVAPSLFEEKLVEPIEIRWDFDQLARRVRAEPLCAIDGFPGADSHTSRANVGSARSAICFISRGCECKRMGMIAIGRSGWLSASLCARAKPVNRQSIPPPPQAVLRRLYVVVDTPRRASSSIARSGNHRIALFIQFLHHRIGCGKTWTSLAALDTAAAPY